MRRTTSLLVLAVLIGCGRSPTPEPPKPAAAKAPPPEPILVPAEPMIDTARSFEFTKKCGGFDDAAFKRMESADEVLAVEGDSADFKGDRPFKGMGATDSIGSGGARYGGRSAGAAGRPTPTPGVDTSDGVASSEAAPSADVTQGALRLKDGVTEFPLEHTDVRARVSGYLAAVDVEQRFGNPYDKPIEAVYMFPLPSSAAVNGFVLEVAGRKIVGVVRPREEALRIYEEARARGQRASLLTQEKPNIFTQSVANIAPGEKVDVKITYYERLRYEDKHYEFVFPMVVEPRYGTSVTPTVRRPEQRSGHDISLSLDINAGLPIRDVECKTHAVTIAKAGAKRRSVTLAGADEIPNRDFVCRWTVAGAETQFGALSHFGKKGGFFTLMMQPPAEPADDKVTPREITFILDVSGSMHGFPVEMSKEIVTRTLDELRPEDVFNIVVFSGGNAQLWDSPHPKTAENVAAAKAFLSNFSGSGGTEMLAGLKRALNATHDAKFLQMYCFMTDGCVGNEDRILETIKRHGADARFFAFGPGSSVNRFLLDGISEHGHGMTQYANPRDEQAADRAVARFFDAIDSPVLVDVAIDWNGLPVEEVYPKRLPDLFAGQTINVVGRYTKAARGTAYVTGRIGAKAVRLPVAVELLAHEPAHEALAPIWARHKIHDLADAKAITDLAVEFQLMSAYTAFVAVDDAVVKGGGDPARIDQPVELPEGVNRKTTVGDR